MGWTSQEIAEAVAAAFGFLALVAGIADWRHRRRADLDRVSLFDWRNIQVYALIGMCLALGVLATIGVR